MKLYRFTVLIALLFICASADNMVFGVEKSKVQSIDEIAYGLGGDSADAVYWLISAGGEIENTVIWGKRDRLSTGHTFVGLHTFSGGHPDSVTIIISDGKVFGYRAFYPELEARKVLSFLRQSGGADGGEQQQFRQVCKSSGVVHLAYYIIDYCQPASEDSYTFIFIADEKKLKR